MIVVLQGWYAIGPQDDTRKMIRVGPQAIYILLQELARQDMLLLPAEVSDLGRCQVACAFVQPHLLQLSSVEVHHDFAT